jgi:predicted phosphohydrolase
MMKNPLISLHSDFHFERFGSSKTFPTLVKEGLSDVLILAGDICPISWYKDLNELTDQVSIGLELNFHKWIKQHAKLVGRIYIVTGNHEYYGNSINARIGRPAWIPDNVIVFEDDGAAYDDYMGVRFTGCTLWTDFNNNDPLVKLAAQSRLSDYRAITGSNGSLITADELHQLHIKQRNQLLATINNSPLPCFVITHHSPDDGLSCRSPDAVSHGFHCTGLFDQLEFPVFAWAFGHTHEGGHTTWRPSVRIEKFPHVGQNKEFDCITNQYGYADRHEETGYRRWHWYEVGDNRHPADALNEKTLAIMRQRIPFLAQVREISETIRKAIFDPIGIPSNGSCLHISLFLQQALTKFIPEINFVLCGGSPDTADEHYDGEQGILGTDNQWHGHYWLSFELLGDQFVVDITADQFGYDEVVIMPSQYYGSPYREGNRELVAEHAQELVDEDYSTKNSFEELITPFISEEQQEPQQHNENQLDLFA